MADNATAGYKERYLQALDAQERLQRQFEVQLDLLKRAVVNLSGAAHGLDKNLDAELLLLREKMRGAKGAQVVEQLERVQAAVEQFERNRELENTAAAKAMVKLVEQYLELKIPTETKKKLQQFSRGIKQSLNSYRLYPAVLSELSALQQTVLTAAANPPTSFWQRLKSGKTLNKLEAEDSAPVLEGTVIERHQSLEPVSESEQLQIDGFDDEARVGKSHPEAVRLNKELIDDEDGYEQVAYRIAETLQELIDKIQPNDVIKHKVDIVRIRIKRGMDWYALAVTLEDIRDILLLRYLDVDREFSDYLKHVNEELVSISNVLGVAFEREKTQREAAGVLTEAVSSQMVNLRKSVTSTDNIDVLKQNVSSHIEKIQQALTQYHQAEKADPDSSLTDQLRALIERVRSVESESQKTKEMLEEERYKATHDPLTELPNREAYNERAYHELQRYKRYSRPLTLAVCDVDHFKRINDNYGHQAGDKVLTLIARILSTRLRKVDFVARYGGEEFVILMPETSSSQALSVLDKIRAAIGKSAFRFKDKPVTITISFGIALFGVEDTVESVFERADEALYQAKNQGRNQCIIAAGTPNSDQPDAGN